VFGSRLSSWIVCGFVLVHKTGDSHTRVWLKAVFVDCLWLCSKSQDAICSVRDFIYAMYPRLL
jgi:hypothetical protein